MKVKEIMHILIATIKFGIGGGGVLVLFCDWRGSSRVGYHECGY